MKLQTRYRLRVAAALAIFLTSLVGFGSIALAAVPDEPAEDRGRSEAAAASSGEGKDGKSDCDPGSHHSDTGHGANTDGGSNQYHNTCETEHDPDNGVGDGAA